MGSKGQITVFIILGIILLGIFSLFLYFSGSMIEDSVTSASRDVVEDVPSEFIAIQLYTESCIETTAKEALIILGQQGGHLYPTTVGEYSLSDPSNSDGVNLDPLLIPYWHYNSMENGQSSVTVASLQPSLDDEDDYYSIAAQLGRYVDEEIEDCLVGYHSFIEQGYNVDYNEKSTSVRIFDEELDFTMTMPMSANVGEVEAEMTVFYSDIDLNLKHYYEVADEITQSERDYTFLENQLLELLIIHTGETLDSFPPFSGSGFNEVNYLFWEVDALQLKLQSLLSTYVPVLQYQNSLNYLRYEFDDSESEYTSLAQTMTDNMILPLTEADDLIVSFDYFGWEPYLNINGGQSEIRPMGHTVESPFSIAAFRFSFQDYYTSYDVSYPVLVTLSDEEAFNGEGYSFSFALESNVINNKAIDAEYVQPDTVVPDPGSIICDEEQRETEMIQSILVDAFTHEPIDQVNIGFTVDDSDYCNIGQTDDDGELESSYPVAFGSLIDFYHPDYLHTYLSADTYFFKDEPGIIGLAIDGLDYEVVEMYQKKPINVKAKKVDVSKCIVPTVCNLEKDDCKEYASRQCFFNSGSGLFLPSEPHLSIYANGSMTFLNEWYVTSKESDLSADDEVFDKVVINLKRVAPVEETYFVTEEFETFAVLTGDEHTVSLDLVPGVYSMSAQLVSETSIPVPDDMRCNDVTSYNDCLNMSGMDLTTMLTTTNFNDTSTYITITEEDLYLSDTLTLYILSADIYDLPLKVNSTNNEDNEVEVNTLVLEDIEIMGASADISQMSDVRNQLEPVWSLSTEEE
tara:strand:+ start:2769 stop:5165 length:2397 start_codon:yes stop_codon:yes gene_type:complete